MTSPATILKNLRESYGWTQQQLAWIMGVSRVTIANIEIGKRPISEKDWKNYSEVFDLPVKAIKQGMTSVPKLAVKPWNTAKFKELLLYILHKVGMKPNVGKTVVYKLLYFCDFNMYEKYGRSITGMTYIKLPKWPAPYKFDEIIDQMKKKNEILTIDATYGDYIQQRLVPNKTFQSIFSLEEKTIIDDVLRNLSDANAVEISEYSHGDAPWMQTKDMGIIAYTLAKKRTWDYSLRESDRKREQAFAQIRAGWMFDDLADEPDLYEDYR